MKIRTIIISVIFILTSSLAIAQDNISLDLKTDKSIKDPESRDSAIEAQNLNKIFNKAEKYFKEAKNWKKIKCTPNSGFVCTKWSCKKTASKNYLILDKSKKLLSICQENECETLPAEFEQAGVYFNIQTKGSAGTLVRILGDNRYKAITTFGLDAFITNGNCSKY